MSRNTTVEDYEVRVGSESVTVRRKGESTLRTGRILGREQTAHGEVIYVDRLLVPAGDMTLSAEWSASGCISSILVRRR